MRHLIALALIAILAAPAVAQTPKTEEEKTLYAAGMVIAKQLDVFNLSPTEMGMVQQGLDDARSGGKTEVALNDYKQKVQDLAKARRKAQGEKLALANRDFLAQAAQEKGAQKFPSGLIYRSLSEGSGSTPTPSDSVRVNYRSSFPDGKEFDSSFTRGQPLEAKMDGVMKCLSEGLQKMKAGGKARLICPPEIAYGETGAGELVPPGATLVFDIDLLEVKK